MSHRNLNGRMLPQLFTDHTLDDTLDHRSDAQVATGKAVVIALVCQLVGVIFVSTCEDWR